MPGTDISQCVVVKGGDLIVWAEQSATYPILTLLEVSKTTVGLPRKHQLMHCVGRDFILLLLLFFRATSIFDSPPLLDCLKCISNWRFIKMNVLNFGLKMQKEQRIDVR